MVWPEKTAVLPGANVEPERSMLPEVSLVIGWLLTKAMGAEFALPSPIGLSLAPSLVPPLEPLSVSPLVPPFVPVVPPLVPPFESLLVSALVPPVVPPVVPPTVSPVSPLVPLVPLVPLFSFAASAGCWGKRVIGAVEGSLFPVPEPVPGLVSEFVAAFAPDCVSVSGGVVLPPEATGSEFEFEPASTT